MLYHYTTGQKWSLIDHDNLIKLCDGPLQRQKLERPVCWFSLSEVFEPSAIKHALKPGGGTFRLTYEQMRQFAAGAYRIAVDPAAAPHDYSAFVRLSGIALDEARFLAEVGVHWGANPNHWYVSFFPVPRAKWLHVERDLGKGWERIWTAPNNETKEIENAHR